MLHFWLHWATMALSIFNTMAMLWLGLIIILMAERRRWGAWLASIALILGALFFVSHTIILAQEFRYLNWRLYLIWTTGVMLAVMLPYFWYGVMLWSAGFWSASNPSIRQRHRPFLIAMTVFLAISLVGLVIIANPFPQWVNTRPVKPLAVPNLLGVPAPILLFPLYILSCSALSLDVLYRAASTGHMMDDLARQRARPWLMGASVLQTVVSLMVAWAIIWVERNLGSSIHPTIYRDLINSENWRWFDLIINLLVAMIIMLLGKPVISYELFTGKALPRQGFLRHWRSVVIFAAGFGLVLGFSMNIFQSPVYILIISLVLTTIFYAIFSWRAYVDQEHNIARLRPFAASQQLLADLTRTAPLSSTVDVNTPFTALCQDVLQIKFAHLSALGSLAPLIEEPLVFPRDDHRSMPDLTALRTNIESPHLRAIPLNPRHYQGAIWAIPLWNERGLSGVFLLGEKVDNSLYTQEEIETARAIGERLLDTRASAEITRRLIRLQRQKIAESQVIDQQTRRVLHDDVLPLIHSAIIDLSSTATARDDTVQLLTDVHRRISNLLHEMPHPAVPEIARLGLIEALRQTAQRDMHDHFEAIHWDIASTADEMLARLSDLSAEVVFYAAREVIRNAARHARKPNMPLQLTVQVAVSPELKMIIEDNGRGVERSESAGSGQGLALHSAMMTIIGGSLSLESAPEQFTRVVLTIPTEEPFDMTNVAYFAKNAEND